MYRQLGARTASILLAQRESHGRSSGSLIYSIVSDIAPNATELIRIIKDANSSGILDRFLHAETSAELTVRKAQVISHSSALYSPEALSLFDEFLDGFCEEIGSVLIASPPPSISEPSRIVTFSDEATNGIAPLTSSDATESSSDISINLRTHLHEEAPQEVRNSLPFRKYVLIASGALVLSLGISIFNSKREPATIVASDSGITSTASDAYTQIIERGHISFGAQAESPPLNYVDDGDRKGLDFEMMRLIAAQKEFGLVGSSNVSANINTDEYSDVPKLLLKTDNRGTHRVDVVGGGLTFKDGDIEGVRFTVPYLEGFGYALLVPKGSPIKSLQDLSSKRVGVVDGDPDVLAFASRAASGSEIISLSDASETWILEASQSKKADAIIYDFPFASVEVQGQDVSIAVANLPGSLIDYRYGVRASDGKLLEKLNRAITRIKGTDAYAQLLRRSLPVSNIAKPSSAGKSTYSVRPGDSLSLIAAKHLQSAGRWRELQDLNNLPNPSFISPGQTLIVPSDFK